MKITNAEYGHFYDENKLVTYKLVYKDIRHMYLRYDSKQDVFIITLGKWYSKDAALKFIKENYAKLKKNKQEQEIAVDENFITIFGEKIEYKTVNWTSNKYELINKILFLKLKNLNSKQSLIRKFIEDTTTKYFEMRSFFLAKQFLLDLKTLKMKWFKNRWGHCIKSKREICLSYELAKYNKNVIDAIITHELAHLIYFDHQKQFKDLWASYCPNWKELIKQLDHNYDY